MFSCMFTLSFCSFMLFNELCHDKTGRVDCLGKDVGSGSTCPIKKCLVNHHIGTGRIKWKIAQGMFLGKLPILLRQSCCFFTKHGKIEFVY